MKRILFLFFATASITASAQILPGGMGIHKPVVAAGSSTFIKVNLYDSANANLGKANLTGWNDWSINLQNSTTCVTESAYLKYTDNTQSGVRCKWVSTTNTCIIASNLDNSPSSYASGETTTDFQQIHFLSGAVSSTSNTRFIISGLPNNNTNGYKVKFLCSRNTATSRPMTIALGAATQTVDAMNNMSDAGVITLDNLTPTSNTLTFTITHTNGFSYVNAVIIEIKP